ncbi:MAG TPA: hypothetical protein VN520_31480 [Streptomyces sp.]|uniref:hypothetical protein n=1 Tax=Streptomyces sp. TaxID=1931 RepID=UPI002C64227E|nr:hypothetical protein [Streptomyces sp.]HWU10824.1 hypothetical protein [Streptomyces sp.]
MTRWVVGSVLFLAMSLVATGCSGEEPRRGESPEIWAACDDFFGAENVNALDRQMGEGVLRIDSRLASVDEVAKWMASLALDWEPGSTAHWVNRATPCEIGLSDTRQQLSSAVSWSNSSIEDLESGKQPRSWRSVGGNVFAYEEANRGTLVAAFPCKVPGTDKQQEAGLPMEVRISGRGIPGFKDHLRGKLASALARTMSSALKCVNAPVIPSEL